MTKTRKIKQSGKYLISSHTQPQQNGSVLTTNREDFIIDIDILRGHFMDSSITSSSYTIIKIDIMNFFDMKTGLLSEDVIAVQYENSTGMQFSYHVHKNEYSKVLSRVKNLNQLGI